jgi:hypothetical protein
MPLILFIYSAISGKRPQQLGLPAAYLIALGTLTCDPDTQAANHRRRTEIESEGEG